MDVKYTKLSNLIDDTFTVEKVEGYVFKKWDPATMKMLVSQEYAEGYSKKYPVTTNKGMLDLGSGQLGNLLEAIFYNGSANLNGKTFKVKSNGKMGMDVRYFFKPVKSAPQEQLEDEIINPDDIPY